MNQISWDHVPTVPNVPSAVPNVVPSVVPTLPTVPVLPTQFQFLIQITFRWLGGWENEINLTGTKLQIVS